MPTPNTRRRGRSRSSAASESDGAERASRRRKKSSADEEEVSNAEDGADEKKDDEGSVSTPAVGDPSAIKENNYTDGQGATRRRARSESSSESASKVDNRSEATQDAAAAMLSMNTADGEEEKEESGEDAPPAPRDRPSKRSRRTARSDDKEHEEDGSDERGGGTNSDAPPSRSAAASASAVGFASPISGRARNMPGKAAEAGVITRVYVENFMCHRKLTVDLCRNVNFIHGQNGSGKSAVLAAVQICLGAGAKRTHRARNLKELVRKEAGENCSGAKVRVTLLNCGEDGYRREIYGDKITVERSISLRGGYNGYKLLDEEGKERSRVKKDLDAMLDQLNIQVENPVAVLDQEEAKKFLTGKAEDKYNFFAKATEIERLDRTYAAIVDKVQDLDETKLRVRNSLKNQSATVKRLKQEWEEFEKLEKLEDKISDMRVNYAWSVHNEMDSKLEAELATQGGIEKKLAKRQGDLEKAEANANVDEDEEATLREKMKQLTEEANEAKAAKVNLEKELKQAMAPQKQHERELAALKREMGQSKKRFKAAAKHLQDARDQIKAAAGNAKSEESKRTARLEKAESDLENTKKKAAEHKQTIANSLQAYEELDPVVQQARSNCEDVNKQLYAVRKKIEDLQESSGDNLAVFGRKCKELHKKVEQARKARKFIGPVIGPIGAHIKIAEGKEEFAKIAESSIGGGTLDRFIVTNDSDRAVLQNLRKELNCTRECGIFQTHVGERFNVPPSPEQGIETVASVLHVDDTLVFNCLVDNAKTDQKALARSKEESEELLLVRRPDGKEEIKGGNIKEVHFLPNGDFWMAKRGLRSMISNERKLKQTIGIDKTAAIQETEREEEQLRNELRDLREKEARVSKEHKDHKVKWNRENKALREISKKVDKLQDTIEAIKEESLISAENVTIDTTEFEEDVKSAEEAIEKLKEKEASGKEAIEEAKPAIEEKKKEVDEITTRNEKILQDFATADASLEKFVTSQASKQADVEKKRAKVAEIEEYLTKQKDQVTGSTEKRNEALHKARLMAFNRRQEIKKRERQADGDNDDEEEAAPAEPDDADLEAIEIVEIKKSPSAFKAKIERAQKSIEREKEKRQLTRKDPEVVLQQYRRAKKDLDDKVEQIETIGSNVEAMIKDSRGRRKRWMEFRAHLVETTNNSFDQMLNKKGSSGQLEFNHDDHSLNLIVQKDNTNEMSQTKDVKALSGGERSFTTLALLLALGESLETPFRVMDEFDVFLDPVARKIALDNMVTAAKSLEHRQFIFITPQDLSNLKTDPMLKIIRMKPPARQSSASQQTLPFQSP
uniref:Rad50/SbcC-type AAA domain-containing protein n=1 Tax=Odontella aurita TaxID=265563 RepID=A0A7S4NJE4_9STRA|mmetsp:Transcript_8879/g.26600  ORF Transcript_8879/g.26600 Transcript_8879/m.26600 type:complete len:1304 (+) Transcript_8879:162-4073(+)